MIISKDNRKVPHYITDAAMITRITLPANWNSDGIYTGSKTGLLAGDCYFDDTLKIRYEYDGTNLYRHGVNEPRI